MEEIRGEVLENQIRLTLSGHIDSGNAGPVEETIFGIIDGHRGFPVIIDASELNYLSSAGLRVILKLRKQNPDIHIIDVKPEVFDIFEMTGFTQMMNIEKAYRVVSIEGAEEIGRGANGTIYRIDRDNVVKVYNNADALDEIQHERDVARKALILGVPTAISYDVVRVGDSYGSVFELLDAQSFSKILSTEPEKMDWCVREYVKMLKIIHGTLVPPGDLPDMKETAVSWAEFMQDHLPEKEGKKLLSLFQDVPHDDHMIHGDYHTKNLELVNDEVLLIDMDTLAVGHPIFELGSIYNAFIGFSEWDHEHVKSFQGFDFDTACEFWKKFLISYMGTENEEILRDVEDKARIVGYTRLIRRSIRRNGLEHEDTRQEIECWRSSLISLLEKYDTLLFDTNEMEIEALKENLPVVASFVEKHLSKIDCPIKALMQIQVAVEEIFVNICNYAYHPGKGNATLRVEVTDEPVCVVIQFIDQGVPYDPLAKEDPDVTKSADEREIGGLGIFMVKNAMDDIKYEYINGKNILTLKKNI